jgi:hypothetical protein
VDIDAVQQRAADLGDIALDHGLRAVALAAAVVEISAGMRVTLLLRYLACCICL